MTAGTRQKCVFPKKERAIPLEAGIVIVVITIAKRNAHNMPLFVESFTILYVNKRRLLFSCSAILIPIPNMQSVVHVHSFFTSLAGEIIIAG